MINWNKKDEKDEKHKIHHTLIGESAILKGNLSVKNIIRVDGIVDGNIDCESKVIIGKKGTIKGEIKARQLDIEGTFKGKAIITNDINIFKTASVDGELEMELISIEQGATFNASTTKKNTEIPKLIKHLKK